MKAFGHNRDKKKGKRQIVYGLMTNSEGRPISIQVYPGNRKDHETVEDQIDKLKMRFGIDHFVLAGDRGMLTQGRIEKLKEIGGIHFRNCLKGAIGKKTSRRGGPLS